MGKQAILRSISNFKGVNFLIFLIIFTTCKQSNSQEIKEKDYIFNSDYIKKIDGYYETQLEEEKYNIKNYITEIGQKEFQSNAIFLKEETKEKKIKSLKTNYGKINFENKLGEGDFVSEYYLADFIKEINSYIINMFNYENSRTIVINNKEYNYFEVAGELLLSPNKKFLSCFKNDESRYGVIEVYLVENGKMINYLNLWSDDIIPEEIYWTQQNDILIKAIKTKEQREAWFKIQYSKISQKNTAEKKLENGKYLLDTGTNWSFDCNSNYYVYFDTVGAQFTFSTNFTINTNMKEIGLNEYEIYFSYPIVRPIPENMKDCKNYSEKKPIAAIKLVDNILEFKWFGFYDTKTNKRVFLENPFTNKTENNPIILKRCE